jgi:hypothetical protein
MMPGHENPGLGAGIPDQAVAHGGGRAVSPVWQNTQPNTPMAITRSVAANQDLRQRHGLRIDVIRPGAGEHLWGVRWVPGDPDRSRAPRPSRHSESRKDGRAAGYWQDQQEVR